MSLGEILQGQQGSPPAAHVGHQTLLGWPHPPAHTVQGHTAGCPPPQLKTPPTLGSLGHVWPWGIHWLVAYCWHLFTSLQRGGNICKSQHAWPLSLAACLLPCPLQTFPTQLPSSPRMLPSLLHATNNSSPLNPAPPGSSLDSQDAASLFTSVGTLSP